MVSIFVDLLPTAKRDFYDPEVCHFVFPLAHGTEKKDRDRGPTTL